LKIAMPSPFATIVLLKMSIRRGRLLCFWMRMARLKRRFTNRLSCRAMLPSPWNSDSLGFS
jgi:hypothetical protein